MQRVKMWAMEGRLSFELSSWLIAFCERVSLQID